MAYLIPGKAKVSRKKMHSHLSAFLVEVYDYCPQCGEHLSETETEEDILCCSACEKRVARKDYKFCPWCGGAFLKTKGD